MRAVKEVRERIQALLLEEFDRRVDDAARRLPHHCVHNHRQVLDPRKEIEGVSNDGYNRIDRKHLPLAQTIGLCLLGAGTPEAWEGNICDDPIDAQRCPYFSSARTKEGLLDEFKTQVADILWVKAHLPEVYSLLWTLDASSANFHFPWWRKLVFWVLRLRTEPVKTSALAGLLPQGYDGTHGA